MLSRIKSISNRSKIYYIVGLFFLAILFIIFKTYSEDTTSSVWDGSVATSFAYGSGTSTDPYLINSGSELALFFERMSSEDSSNYFNKYYKLNINIDLDGNDFSYLTDDNSFIGIFDGAGYTISNFTLNNCYQYGDTCYYSLFYNLNDAQIKNLNINNVTVTNSNIANIEYAEDGTTTYNEKIALIANSMGNSTLNDISFNNITYNITTEENVTIISSLIANDDLSGNSTSNININLDTNTNTYLLYSNYASSDIRRIMYKNSSLNLVNTLSNSEIASSYSYSISDNTITFENDIVSDSIVTALNSSSEYNWNITDGLLNIANTAIENSTNNRNLTITEHESGIENTTVYINDFDSDYDYYQGLNFTFTSDGTIPTTEDKQIYTDNNLVFTEVTYHGKDYENKYTGKISTTETQDTIVYFKVYPVNNNGTTDDLTDDYIEFDLIDNPFANRPNNKAFNGWISDNNNSIISLDHDIYQRKIKTPVSYTDGKPNNVVLDLYASWVKATSTNISSNNWSNAISNMNSEGYMPAVGTVNTYSLTSYYTYETISNGESYPSGAYYYSSGFMSSGWRQAGGWNTTCNSSTCNIYVPVTSNNYDSTVQYYQKTTSGNNWNQTTSFSKITPTPTGTTTYSNATVGDAAGGYYKIATVVSGGSLEGYYDSDNNLTTGTCSNSSGCQVYEMIKMYDSSGNKNLITSGTVYYYYVTRDTNIIVQTGSFSGTWSQNNVSSKPFTFTALDNGSDKSSSYYWTLNGNLNIYSDVRIEYIRIRSNSTATSSEVTPGSSNGNTIYGNWNNLKLGRGITKYNSYQTATALIGGNTSSTGSSSSVTRFSLIVESGFFNSMGMLTGANSSTVYTNGYITLGNDIDRINETNTNLDVRHCASGTWGGNIYSQNSITPSIYTTVKSGSFGSNKYDYSAGIYAGGRNSGTFYSPRQITVEGGYIYNLIGGPLTASSRSNTNDTYIYIKGGSIDIVIGGAGRTETYGNRIIQMTGGTVNYSLFGGSNGIEGSDSSSSRGTINGDSYVYVGGNAIIGNPTYVTNNTTESESQVEAGSIFGIGNGNSNYSTIGTMTNANVIIAGNATVNRNVYGGGNYGAIGLNSGSTSSNTTIKLVGGNIKGSVYGGGNNNGAGSSSSDATINISMTGGHVYGSIYGGSRTSGTVYGSPTINIIGGTIEKDVYGGGEGGYASDSSTGTYVQKNINVTIGSSISSPIINGNVYGGSAFGTVNATSKDDDANDYQTNVTVNSGKIVGSVFGGAKGNDTYTPYVKGDITVNINGGNITNVFGGFDASGKPENDVVVYLNGGIVGSAFGGGNNTSIDETNIYLRGATVTNVYGGSNNSGDVLITNVYTESGTAKAVYGGNNAGGTCDVTNVNVNGGTLNYVYGGGNAVNTNKTNIKLNANTGTINSVYGGGNQAGASETNISSTDSSTINVKNLFGGSNKLGTVTTSNIIIDSGTFDTVYGGNNLKGNTETTNIDITGGTFITDIYGGGNEAATTTSNITLTGAVVNDVYGGGKSADLTTSNILSTSSSGNKIYGGSNKSGTVNESNIDVISSNFAAVYGGNNQDGTTTTTNVNIKNSTITDVYGGGDNATSGTSTVNLTNSTITNVFGGGNQAGLTTSNVNVYSGTITNVYGGANESGDIDTANVNITKGNPFDLDITVSKREPGYYPSSDKPTYAEVTVTIKNITNTAIDDWQLSLNVPSSEIFANDSNSNIDVDGDTFSVDSTSKYYGKNSIPAGGNYTFTFSVLSNTALDDFTVTGEMNLDYSEYPNSIFITSVYGGNNAGGTTTNTNVDVAGGVITSVYGGGNEAPVGETDVDITAGTITNVYGGGNAAAVNNNTNLNISNVNIDNNIYGGGNEGTVGKDTHVIINDAVITGSAYAGGNGSTATVLGNTNIYVGGTTTIGSDTCTLLSSCSVFGGGNAAATGTPGTNDSKANVNIVGGTVYGNIYGGANTSVVYGETNVKIGANADASTGATRTTNILIKGTVFGGGEANASGSTNYDFNFISVTKKIDVNIDGAGYTNFDINGSIFGSGNASSTSGTSQITIANYGTYGNPKKNISIQRTNKLIIDNSAINLSGASDRTNDYSDVLFTLSIIDELDLQNNSTLYLECGANLLKKFRSLTSDGTKAAVTIDKDNGAVTKNVDNRLYMLAGKYLNVATNANITAYGDVDGMTFFGMYKYTNDGGVTVGNYDKYDYGDTLNWNGEFDKGSYVLGLHETNHDLTVDGFYSNFMNSDTNINEMDYIYPEREDAPFYMWVIGEVVAEYNIQLAASKYSTLGTVEVPFAEFSDANTSFTVLGFDYSELKSGITITSKDNIPKIASSSEIADSVMGITMEASNSGWLTSGSTSFYSNDSQFSGVTTYVGENSTSVPTMLFYLYHSKNIETTGKMGTVRVILLAQTKINDLESEVQRLVVNIELSRIMIDTDYYEGALTAGKKYEMFSSTATNISSHSALSTYFSLYAAGSNVYKDGYHRALVLNYILPENTKITMIDISSDDPKYYYHVIDSSDVSSATSQLASSGEIYYNLSIFQTMGAINSGVYYNDAASNSSYYNSDENYSYEEFIFIFDFEDTNMTDDVLNGSIMFDMLNASNDTVINVLGIEHASLQHNIFTGSDAVIDIDGTISSDTIYSGDTVTMNLTSNYTQSTYGANIIYDTNQFDQKLGYKITLVNSDGEVVTGTSLLGLYYEINGTKYYPNIDGTTRIKMADKVGNIESWIKVVTGTSNIATGDYTLKVESFASPDGIYYGSNTSDTMEFNIHIVNEIYGLDVSTSDKMMIVDATTGYTLNGDNEIVYNIDYNSGLTNPNLRVKLSRRKYNDVYSTEYEPVDLDDYVMSLPARTSNENEYLLVQNPREETSFTLLMKDHLLNGTYKLEFILYDGSSKIGSVEKYIIIK